MQKTVHVKKNSPHPFMALAALSLLLVLQYPVHASGRNPDCSWSGRPDTNTIRTILVNKSLKSKKNTIRLYPDARKQVLFFSANGESNKVYQLYLFDMDGKLVNQAAIRNRETTVLTNIGEGNYLYEVFSNDERIENGQLTVR